MTYKHPNRDPNLNNLHHAMEYSPDGLPHVRVTLGSDNITINGDVNIPTPLGVTQSTDPWIVKQGTDPWTVGLSQTTLDALETTTVNQGTGGTSAWKVDIGSNGTVTANVTFPSIYKISKDTNANSDTNRIYVDTGLTIPPAFDGEIKNDAGNPIPISATTAANSSLNPIYIAGAVTTAGGSAQGKLWFFQIAQGLIAGHIPVFKAGYNPSIANNTEESIWGHSVIYPWANWNSGGTLSCTSTSASDTGVLHITGLRASDWTQVTETITMTGTTPVVTTNSFIRINTVFYNGSTSTNVGEIDINRNGSTVGYITAGEGNSQSAQYTVPAGYTAYILTGQANIGKGNDGTGKFKYRLYGGSFQTAMTFLLFQSTFSYTFESPLVLPEKTDLDVTMTASASGTAATCAYSMILIQNGL